MTKIGVSLDGDYGKGKYCRKPDDCLDITAIERIMAEQPRSAGAERSLGGWHKVGAPMRAALCALCRTVQSGRSRDWLQRYRRDVALRYDMTPEQFSAELERLWQQVRPLYLIAAYLCARHGWCRSTARKWCRRTARSPRICWAIPGRRSGATSFRCSGLPQSSKSYDITALLKAKNLDAKGMVKYGEGFFTSLGFAPLPQTFWERSLFTKPADRDVVCHASAWDIDSKDDLASRCASRFAEKISSPSITNSDTTSTSAPTKTSRSSFKMAPTTDSTKPSATPSRCRSRRNI